MDAKFSQRIKDVLSYSKEEAIRLGNTKLHRNICCWEFCAKVKVLPLISWFHWVRIFIS